MTIAEPRQTARYERKREAILDAAAQLFNARGLGGATLADVAQQVGLTTTSVTYYYRRKEDLAAACVMQAIEAMADLLALANAEPTPPRRLTRFVTLYMGLQREVTAGRRPPLINFWDLRAMTGPGAETAGAAFSDLFRTFRQWFCDPAGPILTRAEQNARTHLVFSALLAAKEWIARFEIEDYERGAACLADVLIGGLAGRGSTWSMIDEALPLTLETPKIPREAFLRAATELINEQGYRGASVDRISAKLRVTKGSFYHHNDTKDELVAECFQRSLEVMRLAHRAVPPESGSGWARLGAIAERLVRFQRSENGPLLRYSALAAMPTATRPALMMSYDRLAQRTSGVIVDGIADGSIRPVDPTIAALFIVGLVNAAAELHHWVHGVTEEAAIQSFVRPGLLGVFTTG